MSDTGKQSPLGVNVAGSLLQNEGFYINPIAQSYMGVSKDNDTYTPGSLVNDTVLLPLTYAINDAYTRGQASKYFDPLEIVQTIQNPSDKIITSGSTEKLSIGLPVEFSSNFGGLTVGVTYYISAILSNTAFQVSATLGGPTFSLTSATGLIFMSLSGSNYTVNNTTYDALISIGEGIIPALGNSKSPYYVWGQTTDVVPVRDPEQPATTGYYVTGSVKEGQEATWNPYNTSNPNVGVTQWGFLRLFALQAWNEFNWNGKISTDVGFTEMPEYKDFTASFLASKTFIDYTNQAVYSVNNSLDFMDGVYSNMDDLISADITGVTLSTTLFGEDCVNLGKAIDLSQMLSFGLPSTLLKNLQKNKAITPSVALALISSGLTSDDVQRIISGNTIITKQQEKQIYGAFCVIVGNDLLEILFLLNCVTEGLESLADLLNVKKLFPKSYQTLTVPIYNSAPGPTNSKTYYPIFVNGAVNNALTNPSVLKLSLPSPIPSTPVGSVSNSEFGGVEFYKSDFDINRLLNDFYINGFPQWIWIDPTVTNPNPDPGTIVDPRLPGIADDPFGDQGSAYGVDAGQTSSANDQFRFDGGNIEDTGLGLTTTVPNEFGGVDYGAEFCPAPWTNIMLSDKSYVKASDIKVGDKVYTIHEKTLEWGDYTVTSKVDSQGERWKVVFSDGTEFVGTKNHRILVLNDEWVEIQFLNTNTKVVKYDNTVINVVESNPYDCGAVVQITVDQAHTYITEGFVSHNVKNFDNQGIGQTNQSAGGSNDVLDSLDDILNPTKTG